MQLTRRKLRKLIESTIHESMSLTSMSVRNLLDIIGGSEKDNDDTVEIVLDEIKKFMKEEVVNSRIEDMREDFHSAIDNLSVDELSMLILKGDTRALPHQALKEMFENKDVHNYIMQKIIGA